MDDELKTLRKLVDDLRSLLADTNAASFGAITLSGWHARRLLLLQRCDEAKEMRCE